LKNKFISDVFFYGLAKLVPGFFSFLSLLIFIKIIGSKNYGLLSLAIFQCSLIAVLFFSWLNHSILRYKNSLNNQIESISAIKQSIKISIMFIFLTYVVMFIFSSENFFQHSIFFLFTCSIGLFGLLKIIFQSRIEPKKFLIITSIQSFLSFSFAIALGLFLGNWESILFGILLSYMVIVIFFFFKIKNIKYHTKTTNNINIISWFRYGFPLSIWFVLASSIPLIERLFLKNYLDISDLGYFSSLQDLLMRSLSLIISPIIMTLQPRMNKKWNSNKKFKSIKYLKFSILTLITIYSIFFIFIMYNNSLVFNLISKSLDGLPKTYSNYLLPLFLSGFFWQLSLFTHKIIELSEKTYMMSIFMLISVLIILAGNYLYLPTVGIKATIFSSLISSFAYLILSSTFSIGYYIKNRKILVE